MTILTIRTRGIEISTNYITNNGVGLRVQIRVSFRGNRGIKISATFPSGSGVGYHARKPIFKQGINPTTILNINQK